MALFDRQPQTSPLQQVLQMRQQGIPDNQIVQMLQKQGLHTQQVFDAMSQADLSMNMSPSQQIPPEPSAEEYSYPPESYPLQQKAPEAYHDAYDVPSAAPPGNTDDRIQEVAEAIINEKWEELVKEVQKIISWKEKVEVDIQKLKDEQSALKDEFDQLRQGVLGKVGEYDERMRNVASELTAVQKVFKEVIPPFTENVAELSRITKGMKKGK